MACGLKLNFRLPDISPCRYRKQTIQSPRREILFFLWRPTPRFARLLLRLKALQPLPSPRKRASESRSLYSLPLDIAFPLRRPIRGRRANRLRTRRESVALPSSKAAKNQKGRGRTAPMLYRLAVQSLANRCASAICCFVIFVANSSRWAAAPDGLPAVA